MRPVEWVRWQLRCGEPLLHDWAEADRRAAEDQAGQVLAVTLGIADGDEPAHRVADHDHRQVAPLRLHYPAQVVDDRLEALHEHPLAF